MARGNTDAAMRFYTVSDLSENRALTPEGFLLCRNVAVARTGTQLYGADEVPIDPDGAGVVRVEREEGEVFRPETMASFAGKPVTIDHPPDLVTPENWKEHAVGTMQNLHRGEGIEDDLLYADLLITDKEAIESIEDGKVEVSCGYDAEYEQTAPGRGRQFNIIGNHVALVDNGRCGPRCAIGDKQRSDTMATKLKLTDRILQAFKTRDAKALDESLRLINDEEYTSSGEGEEKSQHIHIHVPGAPEQQKKNEGEGERTIADDEPMTHGSFKKAMDEYFKAKDEAAKKTADEEAEKKKKEEEEKTKSEDSELEKKEGEKEEEHEKRTSDSMKLIQARAEILSPGFKIPTVDCKCKDRKVRDQVTDVKRKALDAAYKTEDGKKAIDPFLSGNTIDKLNHAAVDLVFVGSSEVMRAANNAKATSRQTSDNKNKTVDAFSKGGLDQINQDFWNKQRKGA